MSERWLQEIQSIDGVEGSVIFSNRGEIIDYIGLEIHSESMKKLAVYLLRMSGAYVSKGQRISEFEFYWVNKYIICKNTDQFLLVTICKSPKVYSLLRITLNVVLANLLEDKKFMKDIKSSVSDKTLFLKRGEFDETETQIIQKLQ